MEFDVKMNASVLYDYMLHHTYSGFSGVLGTGIGALLIIVYAMGGNLYFGIMGLVILLYLPCTLFMRSRRQALSNPTFKEPLHYVMDEEGVTVSQGDVSQDVRWDAVVKANSSGKSIFLYTSPVNAWIFPKKDLGQKKDGVIEMISTHVSPKKVNIK